MSDEYAGLGLSPEELEALQDDDVSAPEPVEEAEDEPDAPVADTEDAAEGPADEQAAIAEEPVPEAPTAAEPVAEKDPTGFIPQFQAQELPDNLDQIAADLDKKFEEGDIALAEYNQYRERILSARIQAQMAQQMNAQIAQQRWQWEQETFFNDDRNADLRDPIVQGAMAAALKAIYADPEKQGMNGWQCLNEAARTVRSVLGLAAKAATPTPAQPAAEPKPERKAPPVNVKTLGAVPAAESNTPTDNRKFAHLDKLTGLDYEKALARLSPEEQEAYLSA